LTSAWTSSSAALISTLPKPCGQDGGDLGRGQVVDALLVASAGKKTVGFGLGLAQRGAQFVDGRQSRRGWSRAPA
jgi:hypothetical protein